jgi:prepilin-type N-terminal cleavage/methylation domain-containing protein
MNPRFAVHRRKRRARGLSLVEMLVALAITAALLTATMVAIDASFKAYASAAESASTQTATRMIVNRLLAIIRTSTAHGPLAPADAPADPDVTFTGNNIESWFVVLQDIRGNLVRLEYRDADDQLWIEVTDTAGTVITPFQPLLGGVTYASFHLKRRENQIGVWVLERATMELEVVPDQDNTLSIESANETTIRILASSMPRRVE